MEYEVTVPIHADPTEVWALLVDVERWPEITPSMQSVHRRDHGELHIGSEGDVKQPRLPKSVWRVTELEPGRTFTWSSSSPGVTTDGVHIITPTADGVQLTLRISQRGPLAPIAAALFGGRGKRYVQQEAEGFRRRAEAALH